MAAQQVEEEAMAQLQERALSDNNVGLALAVGSSIFIGASFIIKKKGLRLAGPTPNPPHHKQQVAATAVTARVPAVELSGAGIIVAFCYRWSALECRRWAGCATGGSGRI